MRALADRRMPGPSPSPPAVATGVPRGAPPPHPMGPPMPAPRLPRSGPPWGTGDAPAPRMPGDTVGPPRDAMVGRFSGFQISRFPRTHRTPTQPERGKIVPWGSGDLETWEPGDLLRAPAHAHSGRSTGTNDPEQSFGLRLCRGRSWVKAGPRQGQRWSIELLHDAALTASNNFTSTDQ